MVDECADAWSLRIGSAYPYAFASLALAVERADGTPAVLKVQFPDRESEHEADALAAWNGDGAVRLLARDPQRAALLLERCVPGTPLASVQRDEALTVLAGLLPRLWKRAAAPFRPLAEEAAWWTQRLPEAWLHAGRPFERRLVDAALATAGELARTQGEQVLLHQDLHAGNVLRAEREPWLVIDPKPLVGEREFSIAPIVRSFELGDGRREVLHRLDRLTGELGLDRERARGWCVVQTVAWAIGSDHLDRHVETARWLLEDAASPGRTAGARATAQSHRAT